MTLQKSKEETFRSFQRPETLDFFFLITKLSIFRIVVRYAVFNK